MKVSTAKDVAKLLKAHEGEVLKLDIGCGYNKNDDRESGWLGLDKIPYRGVDIVWDIEKQPFPIPAETFTLLSSSHCLEHIDPRDNGMVRLMDECWRILKYDGQFRIAAPMAGSLGYWGDPTHLNHLVPRTFTYFDPLHPADTYQVYEPKPWKILNMSWNPEGNMEILLAKRRDDRSYYRTKPLIKK
ncbi:MAG: class I SAM-dependent methyltransferase [Candidatus Saccharimonadales bacterium]